MRVEHQISLLSTCQIAACANSEGPAGLGTTPAGEMTPATTSHHPPALQPGAEPAMPHAGTAVIAPLTEAPTHVSATLAANDALAARRRAGQAVLPLAFGEAGLPVHPALRAALSAATGRNGYGPVAGLPALRTAAAGYWDRRGLPTSPDAVVCGPGSKPLIFGLLLAIGADVAVPKPSWVSYAAQAGLTGTRAHFVPCPPGEGGICDPGRLDEAAGAAARAGRPIRSVIVTLPDNPTGTLARPATIRRLCEVVARLPDGPLGAALRDRLLGIGSEIWSTPAGPIQQAAAYAFDEPPEIRERIVRSRSLHATIARAVAGLFAAAGLLVPPPQAAFYVYPDFEPWREHLRREHGVTTGAGLARHLLEHYGTGVLPAGTFGEDDSALRVRVATGLLYGESDRQRETALEVCDPASLPWIAAALGRIADILADLAPSAG